MGWVVDDKMKQENIKIYLAGYFDGEGCILICHNNRKGKNSGHRLEMQITSTDLAPLSLIKAIYGGHIYNRKRRPGWKISWEYHLCGQRTRKFIEDILPYSIIKKVQLLLGLDYLDKFSNPCGKKVDKEQYLAREAYREKMSQLKKISVEEFNGKWLH